jgi:GNAT superfamily N-acetyltransferase
MSRIIREMTPADLPASSILRAATRENAMEAEEIARDYGITAESLTAAMVPGDVKGWLWEDPAGRFLGFAMGDKATGEVLVVAIHRDHEGRGIGKALLARVAAWLFQEGHGEIWLLANPDPARRAHGFYRKLGWRPNGKAVKDDQVLTLSRPK